MGRAITILRSVLVAIILLSGAWMVLELGAPRAVAIAKASLSVHVLDGLREQAPPSQVPMLHVRSGTAASTFADGAHTHKLEYLGTTYRMHMAALQEADGWTCQFLDRSPFGMVFHFRLLRSGRLDMLGRAWAFQVAGGMGVAVPIHRVFDVHLDGRHIGLMEWVEETGAMLEQVRGVGYAPVAVVPASEVGVTMRPPTPTGLPGDSVLRHVHQLLRDTLVEPALRDEALAGLMHMDAWETCAASLHVLGGAGSASRLLIAVDPVHSKCYPVLADAWLAPVAGGDALHDLPVLRWLRGDAARRSRIAVLAADAMARLAADEAWAAQAVATMEGIWPAVVAQRDRRARLTADVQDVLPYGTAQWRNAHKALLQGAQQRWSQGASAATVSTHTTTIHGEEAGR